MKRVLKKKRDVLQRQTVRKKGKGRKRVLRFGMIGTFCKGCLKGVGVVIVLAGISLSFLSIYHYFLTSPYLRLEQVEVKGAGTPLKKQILKMSGLQPGVSLLSLKLHALKKTLERHPWIRSVQLERRFPHTLVISVERQVPRAILLGDGMYYLNRFGEAFKKVDFGEDADFPLVTGLKANDNNPRDKLHEVALVMDQLRQEKRPWSLSDLAEIHVEDGPYVTLYFEHMRAGIRVDTKGLGKEVQELRRVVANLARSGKIGEVKAINFGYADGAVVSFREG